MNRAKVPSGLFREALRPPQTPHDKTAAAAKLIRETEAQKRAERTAALRAARLARDAGDDDTESEPDPTGPSG